MSTLQQSFAPQHQPEQETPSSSVSSPVLSTQQYGNSAAIDAMGSDSAQAADTSALKLMIRMAAESKDFGSLLGQDGTHTTLSGEDFVTGLDDLERAMPEFHALADSPVQAEQAIWQIYEITTLPTSTDKQYALDLDAGALVEIPLSGRFARSSLDAMLKAARRTLTAKEAIRDNKAPGALPWQDDRDPVSGTEKDDFADTIDDAMTARSTLRSTFGFDPSDRSIEAVQAMSGRLEDAQISAFVDAYLTAFFVHGGNLEYDHGLIESKPLSVFFGNPLGCDQLPDGRGIIDCQGFGAVGRLILSTLRDKANERGADNLSLPFSINNHQLVLLIAGTEGSVVDNDTVHTMSLSKAELDHIHALHDSRFSGPPFWESVGELTGPIDLNALPSLAIVVNRVCANFGWYNQPKVAWMEALNVD